MGWRDIFSRRSHDESRETIALAQTARLCESEVLPVTDRDSVRWRPLVRALRERADHRRSFRAGRVVRRDLPFRDVILKGPFDPDSMRALELREYLSAEFADTRVDFHTLSIREATKNAQLIAYFGNGVFAPGDSDQQVADLELSWNDPTSSGFSKARIVTPILDPSSGGRQRPAAWYAGQTGVAIGFDSDLAPAYVDISSAPEAPPTEILKIFLYIGRLDRFTPPVFEVHCTEAQMAAHAVCENPRDWWLRDGEWQRARIDIAARTFRFWFRLTSRTGGIVFRNGGGGGAAGRPQILVRGLLLPELPTVFGLGTWMAAGSPTRWSVDFDGQGRLRSQEILDLSHSVVAQWGSRFGIYRHHEARWADRAAAITGRQDFNLAQGARVVHRNFPSVHKDPALNAVYRRSWSMLQFADERPFGFFDVPARAHELVGAPEVGSPVREHGDEIAGDLKVGLDWLNRAAHVTIGDQVTGLADYWCQYWKTRISATRDGLTVELSPIGGRRPANNLAYEIAPGGRGPLGPLYIEYKLH